MLAYKFVCVRKRNRAVDFKLYKQYFIISECFYKSFTSSNEKLGKALILLCTLKSVVAYQPKGRAFMSGITSDF